MDNSNDIIEAYESFVNGQFKQAKIQVDCLIGKSVRPDELISVLEFVPPMELVRFLARVALTDEVSE